MNVSRLGLFTIRVSSYRDRFNSFPHISKTGFSEIAENIEYVEEETEFDVLEGIPEECPGLSEDSDALIDVEGTSDTDA
jgi:hypothetical protein